MTPVGVDFLLFSSSLFFLHACRATVSSLQVYMYVQALTACTHIYMYVHVYVNMYVYICKYAASMLGCLISLLISSCSIHVSIYILCENVPTKEVHLIVQQAHLQSMHMYPKGGCA